MLNQKERSQNQKLLIASNIAIIPLMTSFGAIDASLLQLYATSILGLQESQIGFAIGLPSLLIPLQISGIYFVKRWGSQTTLMIGFALLFLLLPLMLIVPIVYGKNQLFGFAFFCIIILLMNIVHNTTKGVAFQPIIRESTLPEERGWFFGKMRLTVNGFNLLFFAILSVTLGEKLALHDYAYIVVLLMMYCLVAGLITDKIKIYKNSQSPYKINHNFLDEIREIFSNKKYRLLITILTLCFLSSLPLFVTYLAIGLQLNANYISQLITLNIVGNLTGIAIWGRLIDRIGFMRTIYIIVLMLATVGVLWLFVQPIELSYGWWQFSSLSLVLIAIITGFLQSGLKMALLVGVHNTATERSAVTALAFFNSTGMILGNIVPFFVGFYLNFTLGVWRFSLGAINIDSYQMIGLLSALLCLLSAVMCYRNRQLMI
ncbi:MFS transporter [Moorena sp. SIO4G3]|uniref:MFS transporter n=1 Tax=Moorena sp. SIO4G3 TaxID=2607821 RepID=UPI001429C060|nr:MFS transporter [Moorena sp. SIO4G3]NEO78045.1 MFS transporter [Moorena sp. SIO4G3]